MITKRSIERVIESARIEEVVGNFVNLRRRGVNMIGLCPFHNEKTPSFTVSPSKNIYKCFGCGKGGDPVNFIIEHEGYSYIEAIRYLAGFYRIELEEVELNDEQLKSEQHSQSLFVVNEWAKKRFINNLFETQSGSKIGLAYFKERGFRENIIKKFDLGFAPDDNRNLTDAAQKENHNPEFLRELGLTTQGNTDFFRNRVMFTIHNMTGKAIGFAGRNMGDSQKQAKYINSPESEIYNKRKVLYGLFFAKNEIRKLDFCFLVEGYTDVISLFQAGIQNVVASSGTALTTEQIRLLKRYTNNIKVLYDGDPAGINAAMRGLDMILAEDMTVKLVLLPENHDPDSFITAVGPASFNAFIEENEKDFVLFKTNLLLDQTKGDPIKKASVLKDIISTLAIVRDPIIRSMYVKECSDLLKIDEKTIFNEINKLIKKEIQEKNLQRLREENPDSAMEVLPVDNDIIPAQQSFLVLNDEYQEKEVLKVLMTKGEQVYDVTSGLTVCDFIISEISETLEYFENETIASVFYEVIKTRKDGQNVGNSFFQHHSDKRVRDLYVSFSMSPYDYADWQGRGLELQTQLHPEKNHKKEADQAVMRLNYKKIMKIIAANKRKLEENMNDADKYLLYLKIHNKLLNTRKKMAEILNIVIG
ncbi:MAG: DNA primase [Deltaproteobacteria bacterium]